MRGDDAVATEGRGPRRFGPFILDPVSFTLRRVDDAAGDRRIALARKAFDILELLTRTPGIVLSPAAMLKALWPQAHVQPEVIKGHMLVIRAALEDRHGSALYIESVRGRGYRFIAPVRPLADMGDTDRSDLAGRDGEVHRLLSTVDGAGRGARMLLVTGEAGIGKTALVTAAARLAGARLPGLATATGRCVAVFGRADAFHSVLEALAELGRGPHRALLLSALREVAPTWLVALPELVPNETLEDLRGRTAGAARSRTLREGVALLDRLSRHLPMLLVLEDLHWADEGTIALLSALDRVGAPLGLTVYGTCRLSEARAAGSSLLDLRLRRSTEPTWLEIALDPVDRAATERFLRHRVGPRHVTPDLVEALHERSGGNPLLMGLVLDHAVAQGLLTRTEADWSMSVPLGGGLASAGLPQRLTEVIGLRARGLAPFEQQVLELGSLDEQGFSGLLHGAAEAIAPEGFEEACDKLASHTDLILRGDVVAYPSGDRVRTYRFRYGLYREAFLARQGTARLARRHRALADRMEVICGAAVLPHAATLAFHCEQGGDPVRAARYLSLAAEHAARRLSYGPALSMVDRALALLPRPPGHAPDAVDLRPRLLEHRAMLHAAAQGGKPDGSIPLAEPGDRAVESSESFADAPGHRRDPSTSLWKHAHE